MQVEDKNADENGELVLGAGYELSLTPVSGATRGAITLVRNDNNGTTRTYEPGRVMRDGPWTTLRARGMEPGSTWRIHMAEVESERIGEEPAQYVGGVKLVSGLLSSGDGLSAVGYRLTKRGVIAVRGSLYENVWGVRSARGVRLHIANGGFETESGGSGTPSVRVRLMLMDHDGETGSISVAYRPLEMALNPTVAANTADLHIIELGPGGSAADDDSYTLRRGYSWPYVAVDVEVENTNASEAVVFPNGFTLELWALP